MSVNGAGDNARLDRFEVSKRPDLMLARGRIGLWLLGAFQQGVQILYGEALVGFGLGTHGSPQGCLALNSQEH
ncbi:hypothetical protein Snoj_34330 [Streptomyces nojiriensis]|uniref:Uncharacterized protein n=1 Tax=Streptomyces nojiriensis TaxID=66374 RepID=A0ABQ3SN03_9ACTN|nr:hypothetical protein [Streptomyces nojiriensis]QTI43081.1 hypothetical protein JYK04_00843 [Streptomyces nojiriensis]GHI69515.1 hypothetical protein Snoj_34330 [Streptomyces nojiriensis]